MEVILKEDVKTLGKAGEIVKVKPGFARNFLFTVNLLVGIFAIDDLSKATTAPILLGLYHGQA